MGQPAEENESTNLALHTGLNKHFMLFVMHLESVKQHLNLYSCDPESVLVSLLLSESVYKGSIYTPNTGLSSFTINIKLSYWHQLLQLSRNKNSISNDDDLTLTTTNISIISNQSLH